jgi:hypothetical protein
MKEKRMIICRKKIRRMKGKKREGRKHGERI